MTTGEARAWGWVAHLREGGTTPWSGWTDLGADLGRILPGAQQLELLRRLNLAGPPSAQLADRVLHASAPGRGRPDLELVGAAPVSAFGPAPVDPADLPDDELIRVATSLIAEDLVRVGTLGHEGAWLRPWRTRYRVVGDPWLADPVRQHLIARGRPPGGRGSVVLVLGRDFGGMLADLWTARAAGVGATDWRTWIDAVAGGGRVPVGADPVAVARAWTERLGPGRVRVVLDQSQLPAQVGVRRLPTAPSLSVDAVDLARRVSGIVGLLVVPPRRLQLMRETFVPWVAQEPGPRLSIPVAQQHWVVRRSRRMRDALLRAGYPVVGDPDTLLSDATSLAVAELGEPSDGGVLALASRLLLRRDEHHEPRRERVRERVREGGEGR